METGRFWPICPFGARNGQICFEFLLLCCRPRKGRCSMETSRFWPICLLGARNGQICFEFLLLCCRPRISRFSMETGRFWPICRFGARNGQIGNVLHLLDLLDILSYPAAPPGDVPSTTFRTQKLGFRIQGLRPATPGISALLEPEQWQCFASARPLRCFIISCCPPRRRTQHYLQDSEIRI